MPIKCRRILQGREAAELIGEEKHPRITGRVIHREEIFQKIRLSVTLGT